VHSAALAFSEFRGLKPSDRYYYNTELYVDADGAPMEI
jgi:hypothetical protein